MEHAVMWLNTNLMFRRETNCCQLRCHSNDRHLSSILEFCLKTGLAKIIQNVQTSRFT